MEVSTALSLQVDLLIRVKEYEVGTKSYIKLFIFFFYLFFIEWNAVNYEICAYIAYNRPKERKRKKKTKKLSISFNFILIRITIRICLGKEWVE